jgi:small subunit ribosomal protein S13
MSEFKEIIRISGTDLDGHKKIYLALKGVKGVGFMFSNAVIKSLGLDKNKRVGDLSENEVKKIEEAMSNPSKHNIPEYLMNRRKDYESGKDTHVVSSELVLTNDMDVRRLKKIKSYRGLRHQWNLPVRGQRTKAGYTHPPVKRHRREVVVGVKRKKAKK